MGHSTSHKRAALGATACITRLHTPSAGSGAGLPLALAAAGWADTKFLVAASFVTMTEESASVWWLVSDPDQECWPG